jgi:hypothetical protein
MNEVIDIELVVNETQVTIEEPIKLALVGDLKPIADRMAAYHQEVTEAVISTEGDAKDAAECCDNIAADIKTVKDHEVLSRITDGLFKLHRRWTGLRDAIVAPLEADRKTLKNKVIAWQENERMKAEALQRKLQADADEKARREREALEKKAASVKKVETRERHLEAAAEVVAPVVYVAAPKSSLRVSRVWAVTSINQDEFFTALATHPEMRGYVEIKQASLQRSKAANQALTVPGVRFDQVVR